jgi:hypothetical protein
MTKSYHPRGKITQGGLKEQEGFRTQGGFKRRFSR